MASGEVEEPTGRSVWVRLWTWIRQESPAIIAVGTAVLAVAAVVTLVVASRGDDGDGGDAAGAVTTTTPSTTTTLADLVDEAESTTTSSSSTTTSTTTSTTSTSTTTTTIPPTMPNLVGQTSEDAASWAQQNDVQLDRSVVFDAERESVVLQQSVPEGEPVLDTVTLTVAGSHQRIDLNDIATADFAPALGGGFSRDETFRLNGVDCSNSVSFRNGAFTGGNAFWEIDVRNSYNILTGRVGLNDDRTSSDQRAQLLVLDGPNELFAQELQLGDVANISVGIEDVLRLRFEVRNISGPQSWILLCDMQVVGLASAPPLDLVN